MIPERRKDDIRDLLRRFLMCQVAEVIQRHERAMTQTRYGAGGDVWRHGLVPAADDQGHLCFDVRELLHERCDVPSGHHRQRPVDMACVRHEPTVERDAQVIELRAGRREQFPGPPLTTRQSCEKRRDQRVERHRLGDERKEPPRDAFELSKRGVQADNGADTLAQGDFQRQHGTRGVAEDRFGLPPGVVQERNRVLRHRVEATAHARSGLRKSLSGQVGRHHVGCFVQQTYRAFKSHFDQEQKKRSIFPYLKRKNSSGWRMPAF